MSDSHLLASAMNCTCVRYTDLPHISKLFADFPYHPDHIRSFYPHLPSDPGVYEAAAREMQFPPERRAALVAALRQPNGDSPQLDLLAREGTVAVVTGQQVGQFVLSAPPVAQLRAAMASLPFGDEVSALVEEAYQPGRTMGEAFSALLKRLLAQYGLLHVDPMSPAMRDLAAPAIRSALAAAPDLTAAVLERNRAPEAAGYHAQVHLEDQTSFVFLLENGRRYTLRRFGRDYLQNGRRFSTEELMDRAAQLSPNALLRPVVEDSMLPTVAYIGGPAELAYLAQSEVVYRAILGRMPVALHRAGFTLLDQRSRKLMTRYGLSLADCTHGEDAVRDRIAARLIPPSLLVSLALTKTSVEQAVDRLTRDLAGFDASLAAALGKNRQKMLYQLAKMERKIGRETMARDARVARDAAWLSGLVYPQRHLQERLYSILPFLAKHGMGLIDDLYECLNLDCPDHQLAVV